MSESSSYGKGDRSRVDDYQKYRDNFEKIFSKKTKNKKGIKKKNSK
jgi:hypothetical protein